MTKIIANDASNISTFLLDLCITCKSSIGIAIYLSACDSEIKIKYHILIRISILNFYGLTNNCW